RVKLLTGQRRPTQRTLTFAVLGPRTERRLIRAPVRAKKPRMRTTGNGSRKVSAGFDAALALTGAGAGAGDGGGGGAGAGVGGGATTAVAALFLETVGSVPLLRSTRTARRDPMSSEVTT